MSLRRYANKSYNRAEVKEELYWLDFLFPEEDCWYDDWEEYDYGWYYYGAPGYVGSMDEYHTMRVLTLLRSLNIRTAGAEATDRGW